MFVLLSSFSVGFLIIYNEKKHSAALACMLRLITVIENRATFYSESFSDILLKCKQNAEFAELDILNLFSENLLNSHSPPEAWRNAVVCSKISLLPAERDILIRFSADMCVCNKENISEYSLSALKQIEEFKEKSKENLKSKSKMNAAISVSVGVLTVILLI